MQICPSFSSAERNRFLGTTLIAERFINDKEPFSERKAQNVKMNGRWK
jgi:hypothetical protein